MYVCMLVCTQYPGNMYVCMFVYVFYVCMCCMYVCMPGGDVLSGGRGSVPLSQDGLHEHEGEGVLRGPGGALEGQSDVRLLRCGGEIG